MRCEHGSLALGWIAGHLLWAVRVGELSLQLDLRVCCAGLTFSVCVPGAQGERGNYRAQQPLWPFSHPVPELFPEGAGISVDQWDWLSGHLVDAGVDI